MGWGRLFTPKRPQHPVSVSGCICHPLPGVHRTFLAAGGALSPPILLAPSALPLKNRCLKCEFQASKITDLRILKLLNLDLERSDSQNNQTFRDRSFPLFLRNGTSQFTANRSSHSMSTCGGFALRE